MSLDRRTAEQNRRIAEVIEREQRRLRRFVRRHVLDPSDAEDILQEVFSELVESYRLMVPVEQAGAWLFRVARNRIIDLFRKKRSTRPSARPLDATTGDELVLEEFLPSPNAGPEAMYTRRVLLEEIQAALDELPAAQREVFIAHEIEGRSFKQLAEETGVKINTLLSRKHYAVAHLRRRLQAIYDEFIRT